MRLFPSLVLLGALALGAPTLAVPAGADDGSTPQPDRTGMNAWLPDGTVLGTHKPQTSDGVVGELARPLPPLLRGYRTTTGLRKFQVVPGVNVITWNERDARGPVRLHLMTVRWNAPGVRVDYANTGPVRRVATVADIVANAHAIGGVNGDFYDIGDTGAPLGIGRERARGLLHGRLSGWNSGFKISKSGYPDIAPLTTVTRIKQRPDLTITNLNSPSVAIGGIGLYTPAWGYAVGNRVTDGPQKRVRAVQVMGGRVVSNRTRLPLGSQVEGQLLIGRGPGADELADLAPGTRLTISSYLKGQPQTAITGNSFLVLDGLIKVVDDRELHPRTAIGIDRDTRTLLMLVVDGRLSSSRGYTMVELAEKMIDLGADEALNLDGGGSTTMVARKAGEGRQVVNTPSDGVERRVANGLVVRYQKPLSRP